ncbi:hypothetical protein [Caulobacter segnis]|uniref:hypothetical protein n=1 Tax=Caulobacter segnis TaxID=88688 RepID=UPI0028662148|nr:hypothetical protein [Caulobacter segnis]MDR6626957.1 hypothetical protein [Caulobacter segnis]
MMKLLCSGALMFAVLAGSAKADLRLTTYETVKAPDKVRGCIARVLRDSKPAVTPFTASPRNEGWTIEFSYRGRRASVFVSAAARGGSWVVYPTQIAIDNEALAQSIEDCG